MNNMSLPEVSVIIPTYNRAPLLKKALESVRAQTFTNWEAIVIDDHSQDNTVSVVKEFNDPRIHLITFTSKGVIAASRNRGIRSSRGSIIAFLDSDDTWYSGKLEKCLMAMKPEIDVVAHGLDYVKDGRIVKSQLSGPKERATFEKLLYVGNCLVTSSVVVRKRSLEKVSGFYEYPIDIVGKERPQTAAEFAEDPVHVGAEDYDLWLRLAKDGARFGFVNEMLGTYLVHSENATVSVESIVESHIVVLNKHLRGLPNKSLRERIRRRRRLAVIFYSAARSLQDYCKKVEALHMYWKTVLTYPLYLKVYPAVLLTLFGWSRYK